MTPLLVVCPTTPHMQARLAAHFDVTDLRGLDDPAGWLAANGARVRYVLTDGHLGVAADLMAALPHEFNPPRTHTHAILLSLDLF